MLIFLSKVESTHYSRFGSYRCHQKCYGHLAMFIDKQIKQLNVEDWNRLFTNTLELYYEIKRKMFCTNVVTCNTLKQLIHLTTTKPQCSAGTPTDQNWSTKKFILDRWWSNIMFCSCLVNDVIFNHTLQLTILQVLD